MLAPQVFCRERSDRMPAARPRPHSRSARAFRALVSLYPAAFRGEYGRELTLVFLDRYRDADGAWPRARLWLQALGGILTEAPREHARMIGRDLRYATRMLRQNALVTATIVITLGLGIGANTAVFSMLNAILLRTLPVPDADDLFSVKSGAFALAVPERSRLSGPMYD